jgi:hypothetical protein
MAKHKSDVTRGKPLLPEEIPVGVVGLGLMGTSITACLLAAGHRVIGIEKAPNARRLVRGRLKRFLEESREQKLLRTAPGPMLERFSVSGDFNELRGAHLVIESVTEDFAAKKEALRRIEQVIARNAVIGTNTSGPCSGKRFIWSKQATPPSLTLTALSAMISATGLLLPGRSASWISPEFPPMVR